MKYTNIDNESDEIYKYCWYKWWNIQILVMQVMKEMIIDKCKWEIIDSDKQSCVYVSSLIGHKEWCEYIMYSKLCTAPLVFN